MSETEFSALKETLCAQQELLQKLYEELEAEREASASAVSEALSVILRLEGEKAAVKMESEQYKRLSEQKICHAEESLSIFEDVIYQKEMEVAALDHQVQAYRYKLLSMGCNDLDNENVVVETTSIGRRNSCPVSRIVEEEKMSQETCDQGSDSYVEQMRKLDARVKEIAGGNCTNCRRSTSPVSSRDYGSGDLCGESDSRNGVAVDVCCSTSIHDVFEVPLADESLDSCESDEGVDDVHPRIDKMDGGDGKDWLKKVLESSQRESKLFQRSDFDCNLVVMEPRNMTSEITEEVEMPLECCNRDEEVRLLNEIKERLDSLHDEIRGLKVKKKSFKREEPSLSILSEVFTRNLSLYFSFVS